MSVKKQFLKPGRDKKTGELFQVFLPEKNRNILEDGEKLFLDSYLEKRISTGELLRVNDAETQPVFKETKPEINTKQNSRGEK